MSPATPRSERNTQNRVVKHFTSSPAKGGLGYEYLGYFLQRMKTKWGGCNHHARHIRLNTELVKKPRDLLEYVIVHEMIHLIEPTHSERFVELMTAHYPFWQEARAELNELPVRAEMWNE